jgi:thiaminase
MSFYDRLQQETAADRAALYGVPIIQAALAGKVTRTDYVAFLTQAYHHVKHTVPLMMACGGKLNGDYEWLRELVAHYIEEEIGHQEWILADIKIAGGESEAARNSLPAAATELMVSYAYDTIARGNPVGFFGMVFVLETTSTQLATLAAGQLQGALQLPKQAFTYLNSHGALDLEHVDFFRDLVERLDREADREAVLHAARMFFRLYAEVFRSIVPTGVPS